MGKRKVMVAQLGLAMLLAVALETLSWLSLRGTGEEFPLLVQSKQLSWPKAKLLAGMGYGQIDPLLGWSLADTVIERHGFTASQGKVVLRSGPLGCPSAFKILITGGSTSDVVFDNDCWPLHLRDMLDSLRLCAELYVGAVAGHASGQEFLRASRDGLRVNPDLHISYSGANEHEAPGLVSPFEHDMYERFLSSRAPAIFPNIIFLIKKSLGVEQSIHLRPSDSISPFESWAWNLSAMHGLACANGHSFVAVLQPVFGVHAPPPAGWMKAWNVISPPTGISTPLPSISWRIGSTS